MFLYSTVSTLKPRVIIGMRISLVLEIRTSQTDGGNGSDDFAELELVQNGRLSSSVETDLLHRCKFQEMKDCLSVAAYHQNTCGKRM